MNTISQFTTGILIVVLPRSCGFEVSIQERGKEGKTMRKRAKGGGEEKSERSFASAELEHLPAVTSHRIQFAVDSNQATVNRVAESVDSRLGWDETSERSFASAEHEHLPTMASHRIQFADDSNQAKCSLNSVAESVDSRSLSLLSCIYICILMYACID